MKWRIVGFNHPNEEKSIIYKQKLTTDKLIKAIRQGILLDCNLFSIRGFQDELKINKRIKYNPPRTLNEV